MTRPKCSLNLSNAVISKAPEQKPARHKNCSDILDLSIPRKSSYLNFTEKQCPSVSNSAYETYMSGVFLINLGYLFIS
ncbi:hypothetical protein HMI54_013731 [Coelomomyces lativittatus]|nr:hypothetical protein HMI55_001920 [Coelomomyces lativittatus]KAJ1508647.1 hypothetical protein HMI56_007182 [Coelomomyces lativittatus]KAJ1514685.1 hypothetical protein HMI54_013731 [Coelomomyces lativittatus]